MPHLTFSFPLSPSWFSLTPTTVSEYPVCFFHWSVFDLQCFRCTAKWFSYICVHVCYICVRVCMCIYTLICEKSKCWSLGRVQLFATLWTGACQASLSLDSPGKNTSRGDLSDPGIEPGSSTLQADFFFIIRASSKAHVYTYICILFQSFPSLVVT